MLLLMLHMLRAPPSQSWTRVLLAAPLDLHILNSVTPRSWRPCEFLRCSAQQVHRLFTALKHAHSRPTRAAWCTPTSSAYRYGPRQSERKFGFTDRGRVSAELQYTAMAQPLRGKQAQVVCWSITCIMCGCCYAACVPVNARTAQKLSDCSFLNFENGTPCCGTSAHCTLPAPASPLRSCCMPLLHLLLQRLARKELSAALTVALEGVVNLSAFPKAVVDVAVVVLQVLMLQCAVV